MVDEDNQIGLESITRRVYSKPSKSLSEKC